MAFTSQPGKANVIAASKPAVNVAPKAMSSTKVGSNVAYEPKSSGKMASVGKHVSLGVHHGKHNVAHAVNGASMSGGKAC